MDGIELAMTELIKQDRKALVEDLKLFRKGLFLVLCWLWVLAKHVTLTEHGHLAEGPSILKTNSRGNSSLDIRNTLLRMMKTVLYYPGLGVLGQPGLIR